MNSTEVQKLRRLVAGKADAWENPHIAEEKSHRVEGGKQVKLDDMIDVEAVDRKIVK